LSRARLTALLVLVAALGCVGAAYAYYRTGVPEYRAPTLPRESRAVEASVLGRGPLRVAAANPRYFADGTGRIVLLVGDHTWSNLQDNGPGERPKQFDYQHYLDFLGAHHINFFRLWAWEQARWAPWTTSDDYYFFPGPPYRRTGPGLALDGRPRFDLRQLDPAYFERLRARVRQAGERGIYVSIMLFNGWAIDNKHSDLRRGNAWHGHPFNRQNNVNGVDGDPDGDDGGEETHELLVPAVTAYQEEYVRRVVDSVNDLDNVLFEISNESYASSKQWQYHMIELVHAHEAGKSNRHPVGMSQYQWPGSNADLFASPAEWIAPWQELPEYPYMDDPPVADGRKVLIVDTDHLWGIGGTRTWAWRTFLRGGQPSFMDGYDGASVGCGAPAPFDVRTASLRDIARDLLRRQARPKPWQPDAEQWVSLRRNLGYIRDWADRIDLTRMQPRPELASTGYCLAAPQGAAAEYLIYVSDSRIPVTVDLRRTTGRLTAEWFDPVTGRRLSAAPVDGGAVQVLLSPFQQDGVLHLRAVTTRSESSG
jgi:hypothetical protein